MRETAIERPSNLLVVETWGRVASQLWRARSTRHTAGVQQATRAVPPSFHLIHTRLPPPRPRVPLHARPAGTSAVRFV